VNHPTDIYVHIIVEYIVLVNSD